MLIVKDARGRVRGEVALTVPNAFAKVKGSLGHGWTIWLRKPVMRELFPQTLHGKDKVSRVKTSVVAARVGGEHSSVLVHKVHTGTYREERVW